MSSSARSRLRDRVAKKLGIRPSSSSATTQPSTAPTPVSGGPAQPNVAALSASAQPYTLSELFLSGALKKLSDKERSIVENNLASNIGDTVQAAYDEAQRKKTICEDKRWPISAKASKVVLWLDRFKGVVDVGVNADPINAGLPWTGVKLLLTVLGADIKQMNALMDGMEIALSVASRLRVYFAYFQQLPADDTTDNLRSALVELYALLLRFFAQAIRIYSSSTASRTVQALWQDSEITLFDKRSVALGELVEVEIHNCDRHLGAKRNEDAAQWRTELDAKLRALDGIAKLEVSLNALQAKVDLSKLLVVPSAKFNSTEESQLPDCLGGTRVDLLQLILDWSEEPTGKCIFWLCGKAGTGKSTISRTVSRMLEHRKSLGASFFFKRGHEGRGNADKFFTTIVAQLADRIPVLREPIARVLNDDSFICASGLQDQFDKLLREPLESINLAQLPRDGLTIVIDALDECERKYIKKFLSLLASINSITSLRLRIFVTSRPELPIEIGFQNIDGRLHEDVFLEEVQALTIETDLRMYFIHEFASIRKEWQRASLPPDWPSAMMIDRLVTIATPLFIFAATVCRFVSEESPRSRLEGILSQEHAVSSLRLENDYTHLRMIYAQILQQVSGGSGEYTDDQQVERIKSVVGPIVLLADPLSVASLSRLLQIEVKSIEYVVTRLKSVLFVPQDISQPVQTLHLSFREYLVDSHNRANGQFKVDEKQTHAELARRCIQLLTESTALRKNICRVSSLDCKRQEITESQIAQYIPRPNAYACMYWSHHLVACGDPITDDHPIHNFLRTHMLHWLEAMSWLGKYTLAITSIADLTGITNSKTSSNISLFVGDAYRFVLKFRHAIEITPLQVYHSALMFAPSQSIIGQIFRPNLPAVWDLHPIRPDRWSPNFLILEGNRGIKTIAFSPDGQLIVSAAKATPVKIWSLAGEMIHQLKDTNYACMLAFCSGGKHLAVINLHGKAQVWDVAAGEQLWELELGEITGGMNTVAVSYRGDIAWIDKNGFLRVCDLKGRRREYLSTSSAAFLRDLDNEINNQEKDAISVTAISFSPNGTLAAGTSNGLLMLCELWTGSMTYKVQVHSGKVRHLSFASTGEIMTSGGGDKLVCIWTLSGKKLNCRFRKAVSPFRVVSTPDGLLVWSSGLILKLWDTYTDEQAEDLIGHRNAILDIAFSSRGDLASASQDGTIRLWQIPSCKEPAQKDNLEMTAVNSCAFNHCGDQLVSGHSHGEIRLWNVHTGKLLWSTNEHRKIILGKALFSHKIIGIPAIAFSSDGRFIVSGTTDGAVELWDAQNGDNLRILQYSEDSLIHIQQVAAVAFSPDGERIASGQIDGSVLLWQLRETGVSILHESSWETEGVVALAFSLDGNYIVFATDKGKIGIWDTRTCEILHTFTCSAKSIVAVAIDSNKLVAIGSSHGWPLQVWDGESGALLKELFPNDNATPPTRLEFSDGRILHTPAGTFTFTETHALEEVTFRTAPLRVNSSGDWIQWNGINLLWLPPEYRVSGTHFGILHGETIAVPTTTKGMAFYRLKPNLRAEDFEPKFSSLPPSTARSSRVSLGVM